MAELRGWMRGDFIGWKLLPTQWNVSGSPINAATERSADIDQNLLNYRLGITSIHVDLGRRRQSMHCLPRQVLGISLKSSHPSEEALVTEHLR
jgi:hypothetical protein